MAQHIGLVIENADSKIITESEINFAKISKPLIELPDAETKFPFHSRNIFRKLT
ncbi:MAG: hypothetical protein AAB250_01240 [Bdellovibrionota bacterium]